MLRDTQATLEVEILIVLRNISIKLKESIVHEKMCNLQVLFLLA